MQALELQDIPSASLVLPLDSLLLDGAAPEDRAFLTEVARRNAGLQSPPLAAALRHQERAQLRLRWKRWLRFGAGYDWRLLKRHMRAEGLRPSSLYQPKRIDHLPTWVPDLHALRGHARQLAGQLAGQPAEAFAGLLPGALDRWPFAELLMPGLLLARERLHQRLPSIAIQDWLSSTAMADLEHGLLERLAMVCGRVFLAAFDEVRPAPPWLAHLTEQEDSAPRAVYEAFIQQQLATGYAQIGQRWPVLLRLMVQIACQWAAATAELILRLAQDAQVIGACFFPQGQLWPLRHIEANLSDPHAGGRTVCMLTCAAGQRLIYKPRTLDMEAGWSHLLEWLNQSLDGPAHAVPKVLARADYGWMEWVGQAPMQPGEEAGFAWRLGSLLAMVRTLNGVDIHRENLVACGCQPVILDQECLLHQGHGSLLETSGRRGTAHDLHWHGLLQTLMLPFYLHQGGGRLQNIGAIAATIDQQPAPFPRFVHLRSDWINRRPSTKHQVSFHQPSTAAGWVNSLEHAEAIAKGYLATLEHLIEQRDCLLQAPDSPLQRLGHSHSRQLVRATWHYGLLLEGALEPEAMIDGVCFDLSFEAIYRRQPLIASDHQSLARHERMDLRLLDVPRFGCVADQRPIYDAWWRPLTARHRLSPWDAMARQWRNLTKAEARAEARLLHRQLTPWRMSATADMATLVADIKTHCYSDSQGRSRWLGLSMTPMRNFARGEDSHFMGTGLKDAGLYGGTSGIALALASAGTSLARTNTARTSGEASAGKGWLEQAAGLIREGNQGFFEHLPTQTAPKMGYDTGLAGLLYASHHCARLCRNPTLEQDCCRQALPLLNAWTPGKDMAPGQGLDMLSGVAGLMLVLLLEPMQSRLDAKSRRLWRTRAEDGADFLLKMARTEPQGISWGPGHNAGLCGLSHGNSGIALALAAAFRLTQRPDYREAIFAALDYEKAHFNVEQGNWLDLRGLSRTDSHRAERCGLSWCHGAPGIALARAALLCWLGEGLSPGERDFLNTDLGIAIDTTQRRLEQDSHQLDDLCCGRAGLIDSLLGCARLLEQAGQARPDLVRQTHYQAHYQTRRRQGQLNYWFTADAMAGSDPSLFKGTASALYLQARLAAPEQIPSVLLPL